MLTLVQPKELATHWEWIRPRLKIVNKRGGGHDTCEEIYVQLRTEQSHLMLIEDYGFLILQKHRDCDGDVMFIHKLFAEPHVGEWEKVIAALDDLMVKSGCIRIRMLSPRGNGHAVWERKGFFKAVSTVYER